MTISYTGAKLMQGLSTDTKPSTVPNGTIFNETDTGKTYWHSGSNGFPTFIDNFGQYADQTSADASWVSNDTAKIRVNITNDNIDFNISDDSAMKNIAYDLTTISDTAFMVRFKLNFSTLTDATNSYFYIGLSNGQATDVNSAQDFIGMLLHPNSNTYASRDTDGTSPSADQVGENAVSWSPATDTDYFFEIERTSATAYIVRRYSNSTYVTVSDSSAGVCVSTTATLRYFRIIGNNDTNNGSIIGTLDDIKFKNGVTAW